MDLARKHTDFGPVDAFTRRDCSNDLPFERSMLNLFPKAVLVTQSAAKFGLFAALLAPLLRGRHNRRHVILSQTLREWTRFNVEE